MSSQEASLQTPPPGTSYWHILLDGSSCLIAVASFNGPRSTPLADEEESKKAEELSPIKLDETEGKGEKWSEE